MCDELVFAKRAFWLSVLLLLVAGVGFVRTEPRTATDHGSGEAELSSNLSFVSVRGTERRHLLELEPSEVHIDYECRLGKGNYGCVYRGKLRNCSQFVAIKTIPSGKAFSTKERQDLLEEIDVIREMYKDGGHPNLIGFAGFCLGAPPALVLEYAELGSLSSCLDQMKESSAAVDLNTGTVFSLHICRGMEFMASVDVVHRDLAARNILVFPGDVLKITDFGLTRSVRGMRHVPKFLAGNQYVANTRRKSNPTAFRWTSLEGLLDDVWTKEGDVWSLGIVITEICSLGGLPYSQFKRYDNEFVEYVQSGGRIEKGSDWPQELYDISCTCWSNDPCNRPTFVSLVKQLQQLQTNIKEGD